MSTKKYPDFPAGSYDTTKIFLQSDPSTGALEKVNLLSPNLSKFGYGDNTANESREIDMQQHHLLLTNISSFDVAGTLASVSDVALELSPDTGDGPSFNWNIQDYVNAKSLNFTADHNGAIMTDGFYTVNLMSLAVLMRQVIALKSRGFLTESISALSSMAGIGLTNQRVYYVLQGFIQGDVITNIFVNVSTVAVASTTCYVAIYSKSGSRLTVSANLTTALDGSTGVKQLSLPVPYHILTDDAYYLAILNVATTAATLQRGNTSSTLDWTLGSNSKLMGVQSGQTTMPTTATIATNNANALWMATN